MATFLVHLYSGTNFITAVRIHFQPDPKDIPDEDVAMHVLSKVRVRDLPENFTLAEPSLCATCLDASIRVMQVPQALLSH
jgi:hypothetical protein